TPAIGIALARCDTDKFKLIGGIEFETDVAARDSAKSLQDLLPLAAIILSNYLELQIQAGQGNSNNGFPMGGYNPNNPGEGGYYPPPMGGGGNPGGGLPNRPAGRGGPQGGNKSSDSNDEKGKPQTYQATRGPRGGPGGPMNPGGPPGYNPSN